MTDDYSAGYDAGTSNQGVWGGESQQWLEGFNDATQDRIEREITAPQREETKPQEPARARKRTPIQQALLRYARAQYVTERPKRAGKVASHTQEKTPTGV